MKTETLEKIRNILEHLFELFIFILIMLITFGSLHVHAEESQVYKYTLSGHRVDNSNNTYCDTTIEYYINGRVALVGDLFSSGVWPEEYFGYNSSVLRVSSVGGDAKYGYRIYKYDYTTPKSSEILHTESNVNYPIVSSFGNWSWDYSTIVTDIPIFRTIEEACNYILTGDLTGNINNGGSDFDPHDDSYAFTGFSISGKTATWTGTTERSYLLDMDVEEWVNYTYGFASSEDQEVSTFIDVEAHYQTSDKKLSLPWDEMEANKKEGEFIRQVNIIPCYGTSGAGFYFGLPCKVFYHKDGSVDKVELPASNGILSSDMERPVIVLNEASNGNPVGGDYSYFRFNNAQEDYFIEMKGRWYSTNDFDIYRENLVWKYKYQTILKNDLSSWVSVSDNVNSVGTFRFDVLGKSSWVNLLSLYPVDNRNYEGGSFALFNKITGYSDALDTLKMLLKQPYSLYNGYEIYVRYYRYDDKGNLQYSKWTHFYNNLADAAGSSGSRLDDLNNMYSENQSDKGLTDDELSDLENTGNSRNDLDAVPKNNYDYSSLENATMNFFDLLTNFGTMLGQFPSMVAAVFGFLPPWLIGLIAVAIGAVIFCRFIGR